MCEAYLTIAEVADRLKLKANTVKGKMGPRLGMPFLRKRGEAGGTRLPREGGLIVQRTKKIR